LSFFSQPGCFVRSAEDDDKQGDDEEESKRLAQIEADEKEDQVEAVDHDDTRTDEEQRAEIAEVCVCL
jgi:hypothetical protein